MDRLLITFLLCVTYCNATLFSWGSETKEAQPSGYLPILKVHKYNGIQIQPIQGSPIYLPNGQSEVVEGQSNQISADQVQQLDLLNRLANFFPENNLEEVDFSSVLPYVDLISEDSLEKIKTTVETTKAKEKSKLLKILAFIKHLKEKKLKPFKYAAAIGSKIVHKKKDWIFGGSTTTTPEPFTETTPSVTYPYPYFPYNPYFFQNKQFPNTYPTQASAYFPQYPRVPSNPPQNTPEVTSEQPQKSPETPAAPQNQPQFPQLPANFPLPPFPNQFASEAPEPQNQPNAPQFPQLSFLPNYQIPFTQPQLGNLPQTQYQNLASLQNEESNPKIDYEYKQPPASTFVSRDSNEIRQFFSSPNQFDAPSDNISAAAPKTQPAEQRYPISYSIAPINQPQQPISIPRFHSAPLYVPNYPKSIHGVNRFYTNDLSASGSENVEKIDEPAKQESPAQEKESQKVTDVVTSTEVSTSKSQQSAIKRTILRPVSARPTIVYPNLSNDETPKGDDNKSSSESTSSN